MKSVMKIVCFLELLLVLVVMISCSIETYYTKKIDADNEILSYVNENQYDVLADSTGLVCIPLLKGDGQYPANGDVVAFHYVGYYLDGRVFDSSYDRKYPLIVELGNNQIIKGLECAVMNMDKGSKAKVIIPFYLAYDDMENAPVPPYSNLVFEIYLLDIDTK